jgi:hypothetical protein
MHPLKATVHSVSELSACDRDSMFRLYDANYAGGVSEVFGRDLDAKNYAVLLTDAENRIRGFSTLVVYNEVYAGENVRVIYSGDTIIDKAYWGKNDFAPAWLRLAGRIKAQAPETSLYWLLIAKGHRTYRYLSLFSNEYYPRHDVMTPRLQQAQMDHFARARFGADYDTCRGLVLFNESRSFLRESLAEISPKDAARRDVQFFLEKNPGYAKGDELLCLCRLEPEKLTRFARAWFIEGMEAQSGTV